MDQVPDRHTQKGFSRRFWVILCFGISLGTGSARAGVIDGVVEFFDTLFDSPPSAPADPSYSEEASGTPSYVPDAVATDSADPYTAPTVSETQSWWITPSPVPSACSTGRPETIEELSAELRSLRGRMEMIRGELEIQIVERELAEQAPRAEQIQNAGSGSTTAELRAALARELDHYVTQASELHQMAQMTGDAQNNDNLFKDCGTGHCLMLTVTCQDQVVGPGGGNVGASCKRDRDPTKCELNLSSATCKRWGLDTGDRIVPKVPGPIRPEDAMVISPDNGAVRPLQPQTPPAGSVDIGAWLRDCELRHEFNHANDPLTCPGCASEVRAYDNHAQCLQKIIDLFNCNAPWSVGGTICGRLQGILLKIQKARCLNDCLCKESIPKNPDLYYQGACERCAKASGADESLVKEYCRPRERGLPKPPTAPAAECSFK